MYSDKSFIKNKRCLFIFYGCYRAVLIHENVDQPRGIAVDPRKGLLFWTDWGQVSSLLIIPSIMLYFSTVTFLLHFQTHKFVVFRIRGLKEQIWMVRRDVYW